jgi:hypothetical protein
MTALYRWAITKDHLFTEQGMTAKGVMGPRDASREVTDNPARFSMYDDDGHCYYEGVIYGEYEGYEPLDDFGTPNAGCVAIKINGEWV